MRTYKALKQNEFVFENFKLIPIRDEDRHKIREWRNEQMFHLRQSEILTEEKQNWYFENVVAKLFEVEKPNQLLFSFLENDVFVGYGGLVHINWIDLNAEISFLIDSELGKNVETHCFLFKIYLDLIQEVGFNALSFHKLHAEVYDLRKYHTGIIEACFFKLEGKLREHILIENKYIDSLIYGKLKSEYGC